MLTGLLEKAKRSFGYVTIKAALGAVALAFISPFFPWFTQDVPFLKETMKMSLWEAFMEKPTYFDGIPQILIAGCLWVAVFFLLYRPKLTLVGSVPLLGLGLILLTIASDYDLDLGIGFFLYIIAVIVCIAMAFMTKKNNQMQQQPPNGGMGGYMGQ